MKNIIMLLLSLVLINCGTTGLTASSDKTDYMMVSHGCAGFLYSIFTGDVCYWKTTSTRDDVLWTLTVDSDDEWTMVGKTYGVLKE